jgi:hypothetical protein
LTFLMTGSPLEYHNVKFAIHSPGCFIVTQRQT